MHSFSGDPTGKLVKVSGKWDAYIATPDPESAHVGAGILFIPDVIGIWQNSKLMADQFAANGYFCMVIDEFNGDALSLNRPADFDFQAWIAQGTDGQNPHTPEAVTPIIKAAIKSMKEDYGITKLGAAGYCFGARVRNMMPSFYFVPRQTLMLFPVNSTLFATSLMVSKWAILLIRPWLPRESSRPYTARSPLLLRRRIPSSRLRTATKPRPS